MVSLRKEARIENTVVLGTVGLGSLLIVVICTCRVDIIMLY